MPELCYHQGSQILEELQLVSNTQGHLDMLSIRLKYIIKMSLVTSNWYLFPVAIVILCERAMHLYLFLSQMKQPKNMCGETVMVYSLLIKEFS